MVGESVGRNPSSRGGHTHTEEFANSVSGGKLKHGVGVKSVGAKGVNMCYDIPCFFACVSLPSPTRFENRVHTVSLVDPLTVTHSMRIQQKGTASKKKQLGTIQTNTHPRDYRLQFVLFFRSRNSSGFLRFTPYRAADSKLSDSGTAWQICYANSRSGKKRRSIVRPNNRIVNLYTWIVFQFANISDIQYRLHGLQMNAKDLLYLFLLMHVSPSLSLCLPKYSTQETSREWLHTLAKLQPLAPLTLACLLHAEHTLRYWSVPLGRRSMNLPEWETSPTARAAAPG